MTCLAAGAGVLKKSSIIIIGSTKYLVEKILFEDGKAAVPVRWECSIFALGICERKIFTCV